MMLAESAQEAIRDVLQRHAATDEEDLASVVTGWVAVVERMTPDGQKTLCRLRSEGLTSWAAAGLFHKALYGGWPGDDDDD